MQSVLITEDICGPGKSLAVISAKEALILIGRKAGASVNTLSEITGVSNSAVSGQHDADKSKMSENQEMSKLVERIENQHWGMQY